MTLKWPKAGRKLVEDKANGPAVISALQHDVSGLIPITRKAARWTRAQAVSRQMESRNRAHLFDVRAAAFTARTSRPDPRSARDAALVSRSPHIGTT